MASIGEVTQLLGEMREGDSGAFDRLLPLVYEELRGVARRQLRANRRATLDTWGLVHELYLKFDARTSLPAESRAHLLALAGRAMRQILVDQARRKLTTKRGAGAHHTEIGDDALPFESGERGGPEEVLAVHQALDKLRALDPKLEKMVECRYFAGLTQDETAKALGVSTRTVQRDWLRAQMWLRELLAEAAAESEAASGAASGHETAPGSADV